VILLTDETNAHVRERITVPKKERIETIDRKKPTLKDRRFFGLEDIAPMPAVGEGFNVAVTASTHNEYGIRFTADPLIHRRLVENINNKIRKNASEIADVEKYNVEDCQVGVVAYGCTSRGVYEALEEVVKRGVKIGHIRLKTLWPFPEKAVRDLAKNSEKIIVPEMNLGQIFYEVKRVECNVDVVPLNKIGGGELITPEEIFAKILEGGSKDN